jgi:hypothetical protein
VSNVTQYFTEGHKITAISPASRTEAEATTGWLSMRDYHKAVVIYNGGLNGVAAAVDLKIMQAQDDAGTGAKIVTGKSITTLAAGDDNVICVIELDTSELDVSNNFDWINVVLNVGGNVACLTSAIILRYEPRFQAVDDSNLAEHVT